MAEKIECPVCKKMINATMGRKVHENSNFHKEALKAQGKVKPVVKTPEPVVKTPEPVVKTPELVKEPEGDVPKEDSFLSRVGKWFGEGDDNLN